MIGRQGHNTHCSRDCNHHFPNPSVRRLPQCPPLCPALPFHGWLLSSCLTPTPFPRSFPHHVPKYVSQHSTPLPLRPAAKPWAPNVNAAPFVPGGPSNPTYNYGNYNPAPKSYNDHSQHEPHSSYLNKSVEEDHCGDEFSFDDMFRTGTTP